MTDGRNLAGGNHFLHLGLFIATMLLPTPEYPDDDEVCNENVARAINWLKVGHIIVAFMIFMA